MVSLLRSAMSDHPRKRCKLTIPAPAATDEDWGDELTPDQINTIDLLTSQALSQQDNNARKRSSSTLQSSDVDVNGSVKIIHDTFSFLEPECQRLSRPVQMVNRRMMYDRIDVQQVEVNESLEMKNLKKELARVKSELEKAKEDSDKSSGEAKLYRDKLRKAEEEKLRLINQNKTFEEKYCDEQKREKEKYLQDVEKLNTSMLFKDKEIQNLKSRCSFLEKLQTPLRTSPARIKSPAKENTFKSRFSFDNETPKASKIPRLSVDLTSHQNDSSKNLAAKVRTRRTKVKTASSLGNTKGAILACHLLYGNSGTNGLLSLMSSHNNNLLPKRKKKVNGLLSLGSDDNLMLYKNKPSPSPPKNNECSTNYSVVSFGVSKLIKSTMETSKLEAEKLFESGNAILLPAIENQVKIYVDMIKNLCSGKKSMTITNLKSDSPDLFTSESSSSEINLNTSSIRQIYVDTNASLRTLVKLLTCAPDLVHKIIPNVDEDNKKNDSNEIAQVVPETELPQSTNPKSKVLVNLVEVIGFHADKKVKLSKLLNYNYDKLILEACLMSLTLMASSCAETVISTLQPHLSTGAFGRCLHLENEPNISVTCLDFTFCLVSNGFCDWLCTGDRDLCFISHVKTLCKEIRSISLSHCSTKILTKIVCFVNRLLSQPRGSEAVISKTEGCSCLIELISTLIPSVNAEVIKLEEMFTESGFNLARRFLKLLTKLSLHDPFLKIHSGPAQAHYFNLLSNLSRLWITHQVRLTHFDFVDIQELWEFEQNEIEEIQNLKINHSLENENENELIKLLKLLE